MSKRQANSTLEKGKQKTLGTYPKNNSISQNSGFANGLMLTLIIGFISGSIFTVAYLVLNISKHTFIIQQKRRKYMIKTIYLVRHSMTGVNIENYKDYKIVPWKEYNTNMVLSVKGEQSAKKLCEIAELKDIEELYASSSPRAIATAKYLSENQNISIKLDNRINEINFGVEYISELPEDFNYQMFNNKSLRFAKGETLEELDTRITNFINEKLDNDSNKIVIVLHGIILLSYLGTIAEETFDGKGFKISFNGKEILNGNPSAPDIYKITYVNKEVVGVERIVI